MDESNLEDVSLHCGVCGCDYSASEVTPAVNLGLIQQWADVHKHTPGELKMYHDAEVAVRQYQHDNPFAGNQED